MSKLCRTTLRQKLDLLLMREDAMTNGYGPSFFVPYKGQRFWSDEWRSYHPKELDSQRRVLTENMPPDSLDLLSQLDFNRLQNQELRTGNWD